MISWDLVKDLMIFISIFHPCKRILARTVLFVARGPREAKLKPKT